MRTHAPNTMPPAELLQGARQASFCFRERAERRLPHPGGVS
jgi:hypothetical protein